MGRELERGPLSGPSLRVLGVTGGIGAGKTTVARILRTHGARIFDADATVHELYSGGDLARRIAVRFGPQVLAADGSVNRAALAGVVFADAAARKDLESVVHPAVRGRAEAWLAALRKGGFAGIAVIDAALLVEAAPPYPLDALMVVTAPVDVRVARLESRGVPRDEARRRIAAQVDDEARTKRADVVVVNDGSLDALERRVQAALRELGWDEAHRSGYTGEAPGGASGGRE